MSEYNKKELQDLGVALDDVLDAMTGDGVGVDDMDELLAVFTKGIKTVNEYKAVPAAAGAHTLSKALELQGDKIMMKAVEAGIITLPPTE